MPSTVAFGLVLTLENCYYFLSFDSACTFTEVQDISI